MTQHIAIPNRWTPPKYHLGQLVKQGEIVGMEYYAPGTNRASRHGEGWIYWVLLDPSSEDSESFGESGIKPLAPEELHVLIQKEVKLHTIKVAALKEQIDRHSDG